MVSFANWYADSTDARVDFCKCFNTIQCTFRGIFISVAWKTPMLLLVLRNHGRRMGFRQASSRFGMMASLGIGRRLWMFGCCSMIRRRFDTSTMRIQNTNLKVLGNKVPALRTAADYSIYVFQPSTKPKKSTLMCHSPSLIIQSHNWSPIEILGLSSFFVYRSIH